MQVILKLESMGSFVAGAEVVVVGREKDEYDESFMLVVTCHKAANCLPISCQLMCCSFTDS